MGHLDNELRDLFPKRALLVDGNGKRVAIMNWKNGKAWHGKPVPLGEEYDHDKDPGPWGRWIRGSRITRGLSQHDLGCHVTGGQPIVSAWETGRELPGKENQAKLDDVLGKGPWHE